MAGPTSEVQLTLKISADQAQAVKGLIDLKAKVGDLSGSLSVAQQESDRLKAVFDQAAQKTDSLGIQVALAKKALVDMAANGVSKTHAEYQALAGEIQVMEAELKRSVTTTQAAEREYQASEKAVAGLAAQLNTAQQRLSNQEAALKKAGVDVGNLAAEYGRLKQAADAATSLNMARGILDVKPHQAIEAEIRKVRDAFQTLKNSGVLSNADLAQAALRTEEKIRALHQSTNGWMESLYKAKDAFLQAGVAAGGLTAAAQQAIQFESAMSQVAKTTGMSSSEIAKLGAGLKDMATQIPIGADGLAQMAAAGGSLGVASDQIDEFVRLAATMATAFDIPVEKAGEAVAALTNNFGLSIAEVGRLGDTINVLGNQTAAQEKDIVEALTRIGGSAKLFGLSAEQAAGLADAMLALKMPTEVAATAINAMLGKLQTARIGSKDFQEGLASLGISADKLAADIKANPEQALTQFLHTLEKLDAQSRAEILSQLFGQEHADEIARLTGAMGNYDKAMQIAGQSAANAGAMGKEFEQRLQTTEAQLTLMKNAIEDAAINLGTVFLPIVKDVAEGIRDGAKAIADFEAKFPGITGLAASLATTAASIGAVRVGLLALAVPAAQAVDALKDFGTKANQPILDAVESVGKLKTGLAAFAAWSVGWDIGTWARNQFEGVYQAGVALAGGLTRAAEDIRYGWERVKTLFASDIIKQEVIARHEANLRQIDDTYAELFNEWKLRTDQQGQATDKLTQKQGELGAAGKQAGEDVAAGQQQAAAKTKDFATALAAATKETDGGAKKMSDLITEYDLLKPENAAKLAQAMQTLGGTSEGAAKIVREELAKALEKLGGPELQGYISELRARLKDTTDGTGQLATALDAGVREQFRRLGIDADQALTGVSKKVSDSIAALRGLAESGQLTGRALKEGLSNLIDQAKTTGELRAINDEINRLGKEGKLSFAELVTAHQQVSEAQKKIGVTTEEVKAAQDKARVSADQLAQAVKATGGDMGHLNQVLAQHPELQALVARAARDSAEAIRLQSAAAKDAGAEMHRLAADITQREYKQAAAFNRQQAAADAAARKAKEAGDIIHHSRMNEVKAGDQALSMYAQLRQALAQYSDDAVRDFDRIGDSLKNTNRWWDDINWGMQTLAHLRDQAAYADDIVRRLGSNDLGVMRQAMGEARRGVQDLNKEKLDSLNAALDQATQKMMALRKASEEALASARQAAAQAQGKNKEAENLRWEQEKADLEAKLKEAQDLGDTQAAQNYRDTIAAREIVHRKNLADIKTKEGKADGGRVKGGKQIMVGENGAEGFVGDDGTVAVVGDAGPGLFTPDVDGWIVPNDALYATVQDLYAEWSDKKDRAERRGNSALADGFNSRMQRVQADFASIQQAMTAGTIGQGLTGNPMGGGRQDGGTVQGQAATPTAYSSGGRRIAELDTGGQAPRLVRHVIELPGQTHHIDTTEASAPTMEALFADLSRRMAASR
jgi:TP901 family phage tail tape measure protein